MTRREESRGKLRTQQFAWARDFWKRLRTTTTTLDGALLGLRSGAGRAVRARAAYGAVDSEAEPVGEARKMEQQNQIPADLKVVVNFLRSKAGLKTKTGILNGKRHEYFKGKHAVKALLSPSYTKVHPPSLAPITSPDTAVQLLHSLIPFAYFLRVDRSDQSVGGAKLLQINQMQLFHPDHFYAWFWEGSQLKTVLGGIAMVAVILAGVMFPLWPAKLRIGVWYLSIAVLGLIGAFFGLAIVRLILYIITWFTAPPGLWIFPNLFEDVGFFDSFKPLYAWDYPPPKKSERKRLEREQKAAAKEQRKEEKRAKKAAASAASSGRSTPAPTHAGAKKGVEGAGTVNGEPRIVELGPDDE